MKRAENWRLLWSAIGGACLFVLVGIVGVADTPPVTFFGCLTPGGTLTHVTTSGQQPQCETGLTLVSWNQIGPRGPEGLQGPQGPQGLQGPTGPAGPAGANGVSVTSATEPAGGNCTYGGSAFSAANGSTYACNGAPGAQGPAGPRGPAGPAGPSTTVFSNVNQGIQEFIPPVLHGGAAVVTLSLSPGQYLVLAKISLLNTANFAGQDNHREVACNIQPEEPRDVFSSDTLTGYVRVDGAGTDSNIVSLSLQRAVRLNSQTFLAAVCYALDGGSDSSFVIGTGGEIDAIQAGLTAAAP